MNRLSPKTSGAVVKRKPIAIEDLVAWVYRDQKADVVMERGVSLNRVEQLINDFGVCPAEYAHGEQINRTMTTDSAAMIERHGLAGGARSSGTSNALHADAETVHEIVRKMSPVLRQLIIEHARTGSIPDAGGAIYYRYVPRRVDGKIVTHYQQPAHKVRPVLQEIELDTNEARVLMHRQLYVMWWDALANLAQRLSDSRALLTWDAATLPRVEKTPWISKVELGGLGGS